MNKGNLASVVSLETLTAKSPINNSMSDQVRLGEVYRELQTAKNERKELKAAFREELEHNERYQEIKEQLDVLKAEKKSIENDVYAASPGDTQRIDDLSLEVKASEELLSDLAFNLLMSNQTVEIQDEEKQIRYIPKFKVTFQKDR